MASPIVFFHLNDSPYLKFTLSLARKHNPHAEIVLFGDDTNSHLSSLGIRHVLFADYTHGVDAEQFTKVYRLIGGPDFINKVNRRGFDWCRFNFLKWFALYEYSKRSNVPSCWTFDSDTYITSNLSILESSLSQTDWTWYNHLHQLQGWIGNFDVIKSFTKYLIYLFSSAHEINAITTSLSSNPLFGFTLMRAWDSFYFRNDHMSTMRLDSLLVDHIFLECISQPRDEFEQTIFPGSAFPNFRLYTYANQLYVFNTSTNRFVKVWGLNISWQSDYVMYCIYSSIQQHVLAEKLFHSGPYALQFSITRRLAFYLVKYTSRLAKLFRKLKSNFSPND